MIFPDNFFQDEYRCDFLVPELMKRAWAAEIEILEIIDNICKKYNLQYFADYGTLLGAVRHQGFIPWDDDIDITLKRKDYNTLISVLAKELPEGFLLTGPHAQNPADRLGTNIQHSAVKTDSNYWTIPDYIKRFHGFPFPGTSIDIFPLDYIPRDADSALIQKFLLHSILSLLHDYDDLSEEIREAKLTDIETNASVQLPRNETTKWSLHILMEQIASLFDESECDELDYCFRFLYDENVHLKKEWYDESIYLPFEGFQVSAPKNHHEILTAYYKDYRVPVKFTQKHNYPFYAKGEQELKETLANQGFSGTINDFIRNIDSINVLDSKHV